MNTHRARSLLAAVLAVTVAGQAQAVTHLKRGMPAPAFTLPDLDGHETSLADFEGRTVVLIFGELYHENTLAACADIRDALSAARLAGRPVTPLLVVAQDAPPEVLRARASDAGLRLQILHDVDRRVFGEYRVAVMPSVVVIGHDGLVVHAVAGRLERFKDTVTDAILLSEGLMSDEAFEQALHPAGTLPTDPNLLRAERLTNLARQLARRGLPEAAREKYAEALEAMPSYSPAKLGLAFLRLRAGRLAEAETDFRAVLAIDPHSVEGRLGLAYVQVLRGGDELAEAETTLHGILAGNNGEARAHYLMGLIHQQRGENEEAAASFRSAAEALMSQRGSWAGGTENPG